MYIWVEKKNREGHNTEQGEQCPCRSDLSSSTDTQFFCFILNLKLSKFCKKKFELYTMTKAEHSNILQGWGGVWNPWFKTPFLLVMQSGISRTQGPYRNFKCVGPTWIHILSLLFKNKNQMLLNESKPHLDLFPPLFQTTSTFLYLSPYLLCPNLHFSLPWVLLCPFYSNSAN